MTAINATQQTRIIDADGIAHRPHDQRDWDPMAEGRKTKCGRIINPSLGATIWLKGTCPAPPCEPCGIGQTT